MTLLLTGINRIDDSATVETSNALAALAALAQGSRLAIFRLLVQHAPDGLAAGTIAETLAIAPATLSFHLKELYRAGLLTQRQDGRFLWYAADVRAMNDLIGYLTANCCVLGSCMPDDCAPAPKAVAVAVPAPKRRASR